MRNYMYMYCPSNETKFVSDTTVNLHKIMKIWTTIKLWSRMSFIRIAWVMTVITDSYWYLIGVWSAVWYMYLRKFHTYVYDTRISHPLDKKISLYMCLRFFLSRSNSWFQAKSLFYTMVQTAYFSFLYYFFIYFIYSHNFKRVTHLAKK